MKRNKNRNKKFYFKIHPLFILLGLISIFAGNFIFFCLYTLSVVLHEFGHAIIAQKRGYRMNEIMLFPYGAVISGETDEFTPKDEIVIAIAGPLTNFLISLICVATWWILPSMYVLTLDFCMASLVAGIFNLLPVFPLDGGRIFLGYLSQKMERKTAVKIVKAITFIFSIILFLLFISTIFIGFNVSIGIASILLFYSLVADSKNAKYEQISNLFDRGKQILRGIEERKVVVSLNSEIRVLFSKIERGKLTRFVIVNEVGDRVSEIDERSLKDILNKYPFKTKISDIIQ